MSRSTWIKLGVLAVLALTGTAWFERSELNRLRQEQQVLLASQAEADQLAQEIQAAAAQRDVSADVAALREANRDLPKLRNEVRQLRERQDVLGKMQVENQRLASQIQAGITAPKSITEMPGAVAKERWVNAGLATPEAAVQTLFWAMRDANIEMVAGCLKPSEGEQLLQQYKQSGDEQRKRMQEGFSAFSKVKGFCIVEQKAESAEKVVIRFLVAAGSDPVEIPVRRYGAEWRIESF